jgi:hypothetical protein
VVLDFCFQYAFVVGLLVSSRFPLAWLVIQSSDAPLQLGLAVPSFTLLARRMTARASRRLLSYFASTAGRHVYSTPCASLQVSEGIDFADGNARAVIVVGIPFPYA